MTQHISDINNENDDTSELDYIIDYTSRTILPSLEEMYPNLSFRTDSEYVKILESMRIEWQKNISLYEDMCEKNYPLNEEVIRLRNEYIRFSSRNERICTENGALCTERDILRVSCTQLYEENNQLLIKNQSLRDENEKFRAFFNAHTQQIRHSSLNPNAKVWAPCNNSSI